VGILGHTTALIRIKEDVVNVKGGSNNRLVVRNRSGDRAAAGVLVSAINGGSGVAGEGCHGPEALVNGANVEVDLDLVVLEGNEGEGESGVCAEPKLEGHIEGGLRKSITRSANLARSKGVARAVNVSERGIGDEGELSGVANHLKVATLLLGSHGELVPDVHPIAILAVNALASNLDLNLGNELLTREIQPTGIHAAALALHVGANTHKLIDLGKGDLEICAVSEVSISGDHALHAASEIGLAVESLLNGFNSKVSVSAVSYFPESNLRVTCKVNILSAISDELHKTSSHFIILLKKKNFDFLF
jgi:hypothetical protein